MDIAHIRKEFSKHEVLNKKDLDANPFVQFSKWLEEAIAAKISEPNAMILATVDEDLMPSQRSVLLKFFDENGLVFFTNYHSQKAKEMAGNERVSLLFPWLDLQRQVIVRGFVEKVSKEQSLKYFLSRPEGSQLGAWVSPQSRVIESRDFLALQWQKMREKFKNGKIPLPDFWGGYRVKARSFEFWQGQPNRLHDRFRYQYDSQHNTWNIERLAP